MPGCSSCLLTGADDHQAHLNVGTSLHLHLMTVSTQSWNDHLLRLARIQIHLKTFTGIHGLQGEATANEIERTGSPTEIELTIRGTFRHGHLWPNRRANSPLL